MIVRGWFEDTHLDENSLYLSCQAFVTCKYQKYQFAYCQYHEAVSLCDS